MEPIKEIKKCPVCQRDKTNSIFHKGNQNFMQCSACGLVFQWPQPKLETNMQMYQCWGEHYYLAEDKIKLDFDSSFDSRLKQIEQHREFNRLLDVGCSIGAFLVAARRKGWDTYGVEISQPSALYAKNIKGLNVFSGTLKEANYRDEYFDVVNIWALLEHVLNPAEILCEAHRVLRKGGAIAFCVPNFNCLPIKLIGKKYRYIEDGHLFYFTRNSIVRLLNNTGFKLSNISSEYFSPLTFIEDLFGIKPDTLKTETKEREMVAAVKGKKAHQIIIRPAWRAFMFLLRKFYLGEEFRVLAIKE